jgi:primosomal replication protein N
MRDEGPLRNEPNNRLVFSPPVHEGGLPENVEILKQRGWHKESQHERQAQTSVPKFAAAGSKLHAAQFPLEPNEGGIVPDTL